MSFRAEHVLELHRKVRKMRSKLCKEIFGHIMAVIVFSGLVIVSVVDVLKYKDGDLRKLLAAVIAICHFGIFATSILHLKYCGVTELNPLKCKIWIYLEVYNIAATTMFIVLATRHLLPPPFHQWTGTSFLLIVYWLPLIMYKTSQVCRMLELVNILNYLQDDTMDPITKPRYPKTEPTVQHSVHHLHQLANSRADASSSTTFVPQFATSVRAYPPMPSVSKSASSPHIPYEWALIDSMSNALP